jgi:hypothetical protein
VEGSILEGLKAPANREEVLVDILEGFKAPANMEEVLGDMLEGLWPGTSPVWSWFTGVIPSIFRHGSRLLL